MRAVNTVVDRQSLPTLAELGGPELDHSEMLPANFQWPDAKPSLDQGSCGACWAFSAIGAIESTMAIKKYRANVPPTTTHDDDDDNNDDDDGSSSHLGLVRTS